jgi:intracellular septation protein A
MLLSDTGAGQAGQHEGPFAVETSRDHTTVAETEQAPAGSPSRTGSPMAARFRSIAMIVIFDVVAPLVAYSQFRSAGLSAVTALLLSGVFPAAGVAIGAIVNRRIDVVGVLVLTGIVVGTVLGLVTHNAKLVLVEGSVPTAVFGVACLGSLRARRPLMYTFALELTGPDTPKGREMTTLWQHEEFRRVFRVINTVWGVGFLLEAALRVIIVYNTSTGTALATSKVTPFIWAAALSVWTVAYGAQQRKKGERLAAAASRERPAETPGEVPAPAAEP